MLSERARPPSASEGIRVRFRHRYVLYPGNPGYARGAGRRRLTLEMAIENGVAKLGQKMRRVKVNPKRRCNDCGLSEGRTGLVYFGDGAYERRRCCSSSDWVTLDFKDASLRSMGDRDTHDDLHMDVRRWDSKPLHEYLPPDASDKDFYTAINLEREGCEIQLGSTVSQPRDYSDSDFGDTDSLLSVHGWSDEDGDRS